MTSPAAAAAAAAVAAGGLAGTPYRGTAAWTPQGYAPAAAAAAAAAAVAQQAYRYTTPLAQPTYATYTPHAIATPTTATVSPNNLKKLNLEIKYVDQAKIITTMISYNISTNFADEQED